MVNPLSEYVGHRLIEAVERGLIPLPIVRLGIRALCRNQLKQLQHGGLDVVRRRQDEFREAALAGPIALTPERANEQHYEVPAAFYSAVLGPRRKYSCCYWPDGVNSLAEAEERALRETAAHAELADGQEVLELGCGWGSLTLWMLERIPRLSVTAVSNSHSQRAFICAEAERRGIGDRLRVITADMNDFVAEGRFDRIVSVEMFEHLRNHRRFLNRLADWLTPQGKLFVHIFCHRSSSYPFGDQRATEWLGRNFFTGGMMPSDDWLTSCGSELRLERQWRWNGEHYAKTSAAWIANMEQRRPELVRLLATVYGPAQAKRWFRRWRLLFLAGEEMFAMHGGQEWYVSHYLFAPQAAACEPAYNNGEHALPGFRPTS